MPRPVGSTSRGTYPLDAVYKHLGPEREIIAGAVWAELLSIGLVEREDDDE
jgi:hypothetical protein